MRHKFIFTFLATMFLTACGDKICPPNDEQKTYMNSVNSKFSEKLVIKHVPCYYDYMYVYLNSDYDKNLIDSLENDYKQTIGFVEFLVHDKKGKLIRGNTGSM